MADVEYRCFVGGLAWATTDQSLGQAFSQFGEVIESKIVNDRETGRSRGFGFVIFKDEQSMRDAIEGLNGQELDGHNITVNEAQSPGSGGGGGGVSLAHAVMAEAMEAAVVVVATDAVRAEVATEEVVVTEEAVAVDMVVVMVVVMAAAAVAVTEVTVAVTEETGEINCLAVI